MREKFNFLLSSGTLIVILKKCWKVKSDFVYQPYEKIIFGQNMCPAIDCSNIQHRNITCSTQNLQKRTGQQSWV